MSSTGSRRASWWARPVKRQRRSAANTRSGRCRGRASSSVQVNAFAYTRTHMDLHLVDGTYELFRHFYAVPAATDGNGREIGAVRGVLRSVLSMIERGATHIGVATDHIVESFRNGLYAGYKTSEGVPEALMSQFPILEGALEAMGVAVWPMVDFEADDALASAAAKGALDDRVRQVIICTPDKDLSQCVVGAR